MDVDEGGAKRRPVKMLGARRVSVLILAEFLWAVVAVPLLMSVLVAFFVPILTIPLTAEGARWSARVLGADAPSAHDRGGYFRWLWGRVTEVGFWRSDLPIALISLVLAIVSFLITILGVLFSATFLAAPFLAAPDHPIWIGVDGKTYLTSFSQSWWTIIPGAVCMAMLLVLLWGVQCLRLWVVPALSIDPAEQRARRLAGQVQDLEQGRTTLVDAAEAERTRIERDLHDGAQQSLVALTLTLGRTRLAAEAAVHRNTGSDPAQVLTLVDTAQDQAEEALRQLREVVHGIHPAVLTDLGLAPAARELADRSGLDIDVRITGTAVPSPSVSTAVYFALAEALTNVARHSGTREAVLALDLTPLGVDASVSDRGRGGASARTAGATGLAGLAQRLESVGGSLDVTSPPGGGTRVDIHAPLAGRAAPPTVQ